MKSLDLMLKQILGLGFSLLLVLLTAFAKPGINTEIFKSDRSVFIVAVKKKGQIDRELREQLFRYMSDRTRTRARRADTFDSGHQTLEDSQSERKKLDRPTPFIVPGAASDEMLKARIEEQFRKQKKFRLVNSVKEADIVFVVQGEYIWSYSRGDQMMRAEGDDESYAVARLNAVALPAAAYQERPSKMEKMLEVAPWRGVEIGSIDYNSFFKEASAEKLIKRFHKEVLKK